MLLSDMVSDGYFNPRSHEGSDDDQAQRTSTTMDFNPRSHEGSDSRIETEVDQIKISIHAPTRGATSIKPQRSCMTIFQSTLPRGERLFTHGAHAFYTEFQSTLPRGERQDGSNPRERSGDFNPRSHEGSDD